jgi:ATP-binding cassette, subfamily C, bacteriocin exporter
MEVNDENNRKIEIGYVEHPQESVNQAPKSPRPPKRSFLRALLPFSISVRPEAARTWKGIFQPLLDLVIVLFEIFRDVVTLPFKLFGGLRKKKRIPKVRQHDITDCGAACLSSVASFYQLQMPIARIRQYASTDKKGTNVLGMIEAAEKLGFQAKGVRGPFESLFKIPLPAIAHVIIKDSLHHYVVIYEVNEKQVVIMDPADGEVYHHPHTVFQQLWTGVLMLLLPADNFMSGNRKVPVLERFWVLLQPHRTVMTQALVGSIVYTVLGLSGSIYIQKITDQVLVQGNTNLLNLLSVAMIAILLLQVLIGTFRSLFIIKTGQQLDAQLILGYYKYLLKLPQQFFDTMRVGEIISRVNDAVKIRTFINEVALDLTVNVFIVIFSFAMMFAYYWKLALIMLAIIPLYAIMYKVVNAVNKKQQRIIMEQSAELDTQLVESLNAASTIKRFGVEDYANIKTESKFVQLLKTIFKTGKIGLYVGNYNEIITRIFTIILLWAGAYFVIRHEITPGELLSFYALMGYFTDPVKSLITSNVAIQDAVIAADRLFEIMDLEREETDNKVVLKPDMITDIQFRDVSFRYGSRTDIFKNLNLSIPVKKITAIVGSSGSGKSTLMSLMQNLYKLNEGSISIGNMDIKHISNNSLRQMVSVVPQHIDLFAGTIVENIALGDFEPDMQKILAISERLGITEFIEKIPGGFMAIVGERGANLSGGQRQRLAIARALYRNPEILILDEATSSLDSISEKYVQSTLQNLRKQGKTIVIIAHRLSTIKNADKIVVLHEGKLVEEGTHEELLANENQYQSLWNEQYAKA